MLEDEDVVIKFAPSENSFIYSEGVNKGHTLSYSKVNRCLFLSPGAKQLYHNLCEYAFDGKRDCYPSQATLCLQLGLSKTTIKEYTDELKDAGLIEITQERIGKPYHYHIVELHMIPMLVHSEAVYMAISLFKKFRWEVTEAVSLYSNTELFRKASKEPVEHQQQINDWFAEYFNLLAMEDPNRNEITAEATPAVSVEKRLALGIPPKVVDQTSSVEEKKTKGGGKISHLNIPMQDWNTHHFISYFEQKYLERMKLPCMNTMKERGAFARILQVYATNKEALRKKIDVYMEQDYFMPKGVSGFCSNITQSYIDQFLETGSFQRNKSTLVPFVTSQDEEDEVERLFKERSRRAEEGYR